MTPRSIHTVLAAAAVLLLASALLALGPPAGAEAQSSPELLVGTFEPQQVARAVGYRQRLVEGMQGLQERIDKAREENDEEAMAQIQAEARRIEQDTANDLVAEIQAILPEVAESTGARVIATGLGYAAPEVTTRDITDEVIGALTAESSPSPTPEPGETDG